MEGLFSVERNCSALGNNFGMTSSCKKGAVVFCRNVRTCGWV